jgi:hypothetical protein
MELMAADIGASQARVASVDVGGGPVNLGDVVIAKRMGRASLEPQPLGTGAAFAGQHGR